MKQLTSFTTFLRRMHDPEEGHPVVFEHWLDQMPTDELVGWAEAYRTNEMVRMMQFLVREAEKYIDEDI